MHRGLGLETEEETVKENIKCIKRQWQKWYKQGKKIEIIMNNRIKEELVNSICNGYVIFIA